MGDCKCNFGDDGWHPVQFVGDEGIRLCDEDDGMWHYLAGA